VSDEICDMSKPVVEVQVRAVAAVSGGCAVFLDVWDEVEDMTEVLRKMHQEGPYTEQSDEEEES
jgi:hypothetical protein